MSAKLKLRADTLSCFFYFLMVGVYYALFTSRSRVSPRTP